MGESLIRESDARENRESDDIGLLKLRRKLERSLKMETSKEKR